MMKTPPPNNVVKIEIPESTAYVSTHKEGEVINAYSELLNMCKYSEANPIQYIELPKIKADIVNIFNLSHSVVQQGSKTLVCEVSPDYKGKQEYKFTTLENKKMFYQNLNLTYLGCGVDPVRKKLNCFNVWTKDLSRATFQGVVFDPSLQASSLFLNMWDGFQVEPIPQTDRLGKILWHFEHVLCDGNKDDFHYLLAWLSHIFQRPQEKTGVCFALKSEERGTGKSSLIEILDRLLGHHICRISDGKHLLGNFNGHLANKLVVAIEESFWSGSAKDAGKFRTMITESSIAIEGKRKDVVEIDSYHRFILLTNNDWVVPASVDERRFFVLKVSDRVKQSKEYFTALYEDIYDPIVMGQLLHFFLHFDLSPFDLRKARMTEENKKQILESMQPHEDWLQKTLDEGCITDSYGTTFELKQDTPIPKASFYDDYIKYCKMMSTNGYRLLKPTKLGEYIVKIIQPLDRAKKASVKGRVVRVNCYLLRPLEEMQSLFNKYYHQD